jgi:NADH-quinone oxidoreductase subunit L
MAWDIYPAVFWVLTVSAGLTAFYTARQIAMVFLGQPRTPAAEHAPESVASMTVPLTILAIFAVGLGWAGIPDNFPVIGPLVPNWVHSFVETTIEEHIRGHGEHAAVGHLASLAVSEGGSHAFNWMPLAIGLSFALGGLLLGFLVYWKWMPLTRADELDPVERGMRKLNIGFLYEFLRRRAMFDELYHWTFIKGSILIAAAYAWFDRTIIDGIVNGAGWLGRNLSNLAYRYVDVGIIDAFVNLVGQAGTAIASVNRWFDTTVVNGAVDLTGNLTTGTGKWLREVQTGRVQSYLLMAMISVLTLLGVYLYGTLWLNW